MIQIIKKSKKIPTSTTFQFVLSNQQTLINLDSIKLNNYQKFNQITQIGNQILKSIKNQDLISLKNITDNNYLLMPFLKLYIDQAFLDALHLRYAHIILFFLQNGYQINDNQDALISVCYSLEYLNDDPPTQIFQMLLQYGAPVNGYEQQKCRTAIHFSAKYGNQQFTKLLIQYGADFDAVDNDKKTPLNYAVKSKNQKVIKLLESVNAKSDWKY